MATLMDMIIHINMEVGAIDEIASAKGPEYQWPPYRDMKWRQMRSTPFSLPISCYFLLYGDCRFKPVVGKSQILTLIYTNGNLTLN